MGVAQDDSYAIPNGAPMLPAIIPICAWVAQDIQSWSLKKHRADQEVKGILCALDRMSDVVVPKASRSFLRLLQEASIMVLSISWVRQQGPSFRQYLY